MNIDAIIEDMKSAGRREWNDARTLASIKTEIVQSLASSKKISGENDFVDGIMKLAVEIQNNPALEAALELIACRMLGLFPVKVVVPGQDL